MSRWRCPACDREFSRTNQSHTCVPGNSVDDTFAGRSEVQRGIYDAIIGHLRTLGPVHEDSVRVGVFLRHEDKLAEVRPRSRDVLLHLVLPYALDHARVARREQISTGRIWHSLKLTEVSDVDDQLREWLGQAYDASG